MQKTREELGLDIADEGGWEEFHQRQARDPQKRGSWDMYDHHKARRKMLEAEYRRRFG